MKKPASKKPQTRRSRTVSPSKSDDLRSHYDLEYSKARPNRFAGRFSGETLAVVLDPDVASVFQSAEAVNSFLRSAITAMPQARSRARKRAS